MQNENNDTADREHRATFLLDAPLETVWEVWTKPEHIKQWWGPNGFTNTIQIMQVETGGEWIFTMHGPDGNHYPNKAIFKEVVKHKKIVHEHFAPNFIATIEFQPQGNKTRVRWHKVYETKELFALVEIQHKAAEGFEQTVDKLKTYLAKGH